MKEKVMSSRRRALVNWAKKSRNDYTQAQLKEVLEKSIVKLGGGVLEFWSYIVENLPPAAIYEKDKEHWEVMIDELIDTSTST